MSKQQSGLSSFQITLLSAVLACKITWVAAFAGPSARGSLSFAGTRSPSLVLVQSRQRQSEPLFFFPPWNDSKTEEQPDKNRTPSQLQLDSFTTTARNDWIQPADETQLPTSTTTIPETDNASSGLLQVVNTYTKPIQAILDQSTSGWALSYASLHPDSSQTTAGQAFLATNLAYLLAGVGLQIMGETGLGLFTEICALASFQYHYQQLESKDSQTVRMALLIDYTAAAFAMGTATLYLGGAVLFSNLPMDDVVFASAVSACGLGFLAMSWKYEYGRPYMFWHSLWHLASAYAGFLVGNLHSNMI